MVLTYSRKRAEDITRHLPGIAFGSELLIPGDKPDYSPPTGVNPGSLEHIVFLTLTLSIDTGYNSQLLWNSSRKAYEAENTRYLFSPTSLFEGEPDQILYDMKKSGMGGKKIKMQRSGKNRDPFFFRNGEEIPGIFSYHATGTARRYSVV